jgi:hypothetical protein
MSTGETSDFPTRALWQSYQQSHLIASRRNGWRKWWIWPCELFLFILPKWYFTCCKVLRHGASVFTSSLKEGMLHIFIALKYLLPRPGLNLWTLGSVASVITITLPRRLMHSWVRFHVLTAASMHSGYSTVLSHWSRLMFQRCVLPPHQGLIQRDYMVLYPWRLSSPYWLSMWEVRSRCVTGSGEEICAEYVCETSHKIDIWKTKDKVEV